ncbi:MAG: hypothetical protein PHQ59_04805 [Candidatus Daviesbacteria bacterium]|nr:hypothetical protein [Candidatus Daviesbacteria bacterium]
MIKKLILYFCYLFLILNSLIFIPVAKAADSSPSASIQSKLKALQEEIASRAANIKNEVSKKLFNRAYVGTVKNKDTNSITVTLKSNSGNINTNEFTEYVIKSKTLIGSSGLKNITTSDSIAALGDIDDKGVLTAKRIIKLTKPNNPKKVIYGKLTSVATSSATLKDFQDNQFSITFDKNTDYQVEKSKGIFNDIKVNTLIIAVTEQTTPDTLLTKFVYILPGGLKIKNSTSSAKTP